MPQCLQVWCTLCRAGADIRVCVYVSSCLLRDLCNLLRRRPGAPGLEDGTPAFAAIASACHGFKFIKRLGGFPAIAAHTKALCEHLYKQMTSLKHKNGQPLVVAYGRDPAPGKGRVAHGKAETRWMCVFVCACTCVAGAPCIHMSVYLCTCSCAPHLLAGIESWGPTVAFNLKRSDGSWVGYAEVR